MLDSAHFAFLGYTVILESGTVELCRMMNVYLIDSLVCFDAYLNNYYIDEIIGGLILD